jgi:hypothetical protein
LHNYHLYEYFSDRPTKRLAIPIHRATCSAQFCSVRAGLRADAAPHGAHVADDASYDKERFATSEDRRVLRPQFTICVERSGLGRAADNFAPPGFEGTDFGAELQTFGTWTSTFIATGFAAAVTRLNTISLAVGGDKAPFIRTVQWQTMATFKTTTRSRCRPVEALSHFLAGLEERDALPLDGHLRPGTRVASRPGSAVFHGKHPETANLDPVAAGECDHDHLEDRIDEFFDVALVEMRLLLDNALNEF